MEIKGFTEVSLSDWDGRVSSVVFLPSCNMHCPFCYNAPLVSYPEKIPTLRYEDIENYLTKNRKWIDGVVVTGGEPTLHKDLPHLCKRIKEIGFGVKVDTNGTNPIAITRLIEKQLVDYVALDIKAPLTNEKYSEACGVSAVTLIEKIWGTAQILLGETIEYEFRTTLVPTLHSIEDIEAICQSIEGCEKYALQNFKSDVETINPKYQYLKPFSKVQMEDFLQVARKRILNTCIRG